MPTEVLYRKWRPQRFADVAGQDVVTRTLINALAQHKVSHAYLFSGPRGTGKTTMARLLAKAVNCEKNAAAAQDSPGEPCNACPSCVAFGTDAAFDLIEMDGASNRGIDDIRNLREATNYMPMAGMDAHKVYLIDEVHMLTEPAFNALLKTLEEPPPHVVFILATTDDHKLPATIISRCQRHQFKRIPLAAIVDRLAYIAGQEGIGVPRDGLELIARNATGSLRDAINLLEQVCDSYGKEASLEAVREGLGLIADERSSELAQQALRGDLAGGLGTIGSVRDDGLDLRQFQKEVVMRLRELLLVQSGAESDGAWTPEQLAGMRASIAGIEPAKMVQALRAFGQADLRADPLSPLPLELALADAVLGAPAPARPEAPAPAARTSPAPPIRGGQARPQPPAATQRTATPQQARPVVPATPAPAGPAAERVPAALRKDLKDASAEEIAAMLGSTAPVIPPAAPDAAAPELAPAAGAAAAAATDGALAGIVQQLRVLARPRSVKLDALLNGSCEAVSWQDGILTLGFYAEGFHKKGVEDAQNRKVYEELASEILGAPASIRCIMVAKAPAPLSKSSLVQHAVQTHGATVVSRDQES